MQIVAVERDGTVEDLMLPDADFEVLPGVRMGRPDELLSPAYWTVRCQVARRTDSDFVNRTGTLQEEVGFCLLGGYGITAELATAYFQRLKREGVFGNRSTAAETAIRKLLTEPIKLGARFCRYRFPIQRARRIHRAMAWLNVHPLDQDNAGRFRSELEKLEGVGPKTASWITRNWLDSDDVAILDIHILRAGLKIGLFEASAKLPRDYSRLEIRFLTFAHKLGVRPSTLDAVIWSDMRVYGSQLLRKLDWGIFSPANSKAA